MACSVSGTASIGMSGTGECARSKSGSPLWLNKSPRIDFAPRVLTNVIAVFRCSAIVLGMPILFTSASSCSFVNLHLFAVSA